MITRLATPAAILAFICATTVLTPAYAEYEGGEAETPELVDPAPEGEETEGDVLVEDGEVTVDDGTLTEGDGEIFDDGGCIDCNVGVTSFDGEGRPVAENFRGDIAAPASDPARSGKDAACDAKGLAKVAQVCP